MALNQFAEPGPVDLAGAENPTGHNHVRRPSLEPAAGVLGVDAATQLQSARVGRQRGPGFGLVARAKLNDVAAAEPIAPVLIGKPGGRLFGNKIGAQALTAEGAPDDLLYFAFMQVNARTKHAGKLEAGGPSSKSKVRAATLHRPKPTV
jgi:hypothetical protein